MGWTKPRDNTSIYKTWRLEQDKECIFRLLPAHPRAPDGLWKTFLRQHWGYRRPVKKDPKKTYPALFICPRQKNKDKMITVDCDECKKIEKVEKELEDIKLDLKSRGKSDDEIKAMTNSRAEWLDAHNNDGKWNFLAKSKSGDIGILQIPHKSYLALEILREKMRNRYKLDDITDIQKGIWVIFKRVGKNQDMTFTAEAEMEILADGAERLLRAPLTDSELDNMEKVLPPLNEVGTKLTAEQIAMLVRGTEDPTEVENIFAMSQPAERSPTPKKPDPEPARKQVDEDDIPTGASELPPEKPKPQAPAPKPTPVAAAVEDDEEAQLLRKLQAAREKKAAEAAKAATPAAAPPPVPSAAAASYQDLSEDEFLKQFRNKA